MIIELKMHSAFKNYSPGQPASRLYVKNLSRKTTERVCLSTSISVCQSMNSLIMFVWSLGSESCIWTVHQPAL